MAENSSFGSLSQFSTASGADGFKEDPFKSKDPFSNTNDGTADPFQGDDPFKNTATDDPFKGSKYCALFKCFIKCASCEYLSIYMQVMPIVSMYFPICDNLFP